jgi:hypothetical protein
MNVTTPNYYVFTFVKKKKTIAIILTLQMAQTTSSLKIQIEIIFNVNRFDLVPRMAIMFHVHSLHLTKVTIGIDKGGVQT